MTSKEEMPICCGRPTVGCKHDYICLICKNGAGMLPDPCNPPPKYDIVWIT